MLKELAAAKLAPPVLFAYQFNVDPAEEVPESATEPKVEQMLPAEVVNI